MSIAKAVRASPPFHILEYEIEHAPQPLQIGSEVHLHGFALDYQTKRTPASLEAGSAVELPLNCSTNLRQFTHVRHGKICVVTTHGQNVYLAMEDADEALRWKVRWWRFYQALIAPVHYWWRDRIRDLKEWALDIRFEQSH